MGRGAVYSTLTLASMNQNMHEPINKRLNVRKELKRIKQDPLEAFLDKAFPEYRIGDARSIYEEAYYFYIRAMERAFEQVSTTVRYRKGPFYVRKYGGKYGPGQRKVANKWKKLRPFLELDINTCVLQTRILLDRTVALSRSFLVGGELPSFTSFSDHKKFFIKKPNAVPDNTEYADYMINDTDWFDISIKYLRDKFIVHAGPKHQKGFAIGWEGDDLAMIISVADNRSPTNLINFNAWRLSYDIEKYLTWFGAYGVKALDMKST